MGKKKSVIKLLEQFKSKTSGDVPIKKMYLFGSFARGNAHRWSDIDFSNSFG